MIVSNKDFDLEKIADSGQSFRWSLQDDGQWRVIARDKVLYCKQLKWDEVELGCSEEEYADFWKNYFDMETDYEKIRNMIDPKDEFLKKSAGIGQGIRILRQDPWEMLITFLISQRKSIPAIKGCVEKLCALCGSLIGDTGLYAFPTPEQIVAKSEEELLSCGLGYRAKYIYETARKFASGEYSVENLKGLGDKELEAALMELFGVGIKVASCTMLFGFYRVDAFPIDVWMNRVLAEHYPEGFDFERYTPYNGIMQQYLFAYRKSLKN